LDLAFSSHSWNFWKGILESTIILFEKKNLKKHTSYTL
jgi:hypothetical protein